MSTLRKLSDNEAWALEEVKAARERIEYAEKELRALVAGQRPGEHNLLDDCITNLVEGSADRALALQGFETIDEFVEAAATTVKKSP